MRYLRKITAVLLVLVMCVSLCSLSVFAAGSSQVDNVDKVIAEAKETAYNTIQEGLLNRSNVIEFDYATKLSAINAAALSGISAYVDFSFTATAAYAQLIKEIEAVFSAAQNHFVNQTPVHGDYLARNITKHNLFFTSYDLAYVSSDSILVVRVRINVEYRTTAEQEAETTETFNSICDELGIEEMTSDYDKIYAFYKWLGENVRHCNIAMAFYDTSPLESSAYAALVLNESTSEGFALAFYRFCLANDIDCRIVHQESDNYPNVWNIVKLDGKYYYIDCSNADGNVETLLKFEQIEDPMFLKGTNFWLSLPEFTKGVQYINTLLYPGFAADYPVPAGSYYPDGDHDCASENMLVSKTSGDTKYWQCRECLKCYSDAQGENEITVTQPVEPDAPDESDEDADFSGLTSFFSSFTDFFSNFFSNFRQIFFSFFKFSC